MYNDDSLRNLHKDAYGFSPNQRYYERWDAMTHDEKQKEWDRLVEDLARTEKDEAEHRNRCVIEFEKSITKTISVGAANRKTALRWLTESENFLGLQEVEHWVWEQGILFTEAGKNAVSDLHKIYL